MTCGRGAGQHRQRLPPGVQGTQASPLWPAEWAASTQSANKAVGRRLTRTLGLPLQARSWQPSLP